jgi:hypothetical protein
MFDTDEEIHEKFERIKMMMEQVNWNKLQQEQQNKEVIPYNEIFNMRYEKNVIFWKL